MSNFPFYGSSIRYLLQSVKKENVVMKKEASGIWRNPFSESVIEGIVQQADDIDNASRSDSGYSINVSISKHDYYMGHLQAKLNSIKTVDISDLKEKYSFLFDRSYIFKPRNKVVGQPITWSGKRSCPNSCSLLSQDNKRQCFGIQENQVPTNLYNDSGGNRAINHTDACQVSTLERSNELFQPSHYCRNSSPQAPFPEVQLKAHPTQHRQQYVSTSKLKTTTARGLYSNRGSMSPTSREELSQPVFYPRSQTPRIRYQLNPSRKSYMPYNNVYRPNNQWQSPFSSYGTPPISPLVHNQLTVSPLVTNNAMKNSPVTRCPVRRNSTVVVYDYGSFPKRSIEPFVRHSSVKSNNSAYAISCYENQGTYPSHLESPMLDASNISYNRKIDEDSDDDLLYAEFELLGRSPTIVEDICYHENLTDQTDGHQCIGMTDRDFETQGPSIRSVRANTDMSYQSQEAMSPFVEIYKNELPYDNINLPRRPSTNTEPRKVVRRSLDYGRSRSRSKSRYDRLFKRKCEQGSHRRENGSMYERMLESSMRMPMSSHDGLRISKESHKNYSNAAFVSLTRDSRTDTRDACIETSDVSTRSSKRSDDNVDKRSREPSYVASEHRRSEVGRDDTRLGDKSSRPTGRYRDHCRSRSRSKRRDRMSHKHSGRRDRRKY